MKLVSAQIENFRSVEFSEPFQIDDLTCLVGKNEAGKTAILHALLGIKAHDGFKYEQLRDYPRRYVTKYSERHTNGVSLVAKTQWQLDDSDLAKIYKRLGPDCLNAEDDATFKVEISSHMNGSNTWTLPVNQEACVKFLVDKYKLDASERKAFKDSTTVSDISSTLENLNTRTTRQDELLADISSMRDKKPTLAVLDILLSEVPKFLYTSHYDRMSGEVSVTKLLQDKANNKVSVGDKIFLDFLEYAGTSLEELQSASHYEDLKAKCEGASNDITDEIFEYWSQNEALRVEIEVGEGKPNDPAPLNSGTVVKVRIRNEHHRVSVPLSERSAGFIWFFSFLAQFKQLKKTAGNAILLLDEPGLTLHGKAQADLLRYIQERLLPEHQVIYTTHSPFMVPPNALAKVRVVEDLIEHKDRKTIVKGTKVSSNILSVGQDTVFPLQGHLGYELTQSLFIGPNTLLVEGPSDILYLQAFSNALKKRKRVSLDERWTVCPSGGIDKIWSFASLFGGNKLNIAVLCDYGSGDKSKVEKLKKSELLKLSQVLVASDFSEKSESDIEDLMTDDLYAKIVNSAFALKASAQLKASNLDPSKSNQIRVVKAVEDSFRTMPTETPEFDHFTPADWLLKNCAILDGSDKSVLDSLDKFEQLFSQLNGLLPAK